MQLPNPDSLSVLCPQCGSNRLYKDGLRYLSKENSVQRWLCRDCGYRFSEKPLQKNPNWLLNSPIALHSKRQIGAIIEGAKNLETARQKTKVCAGDAKLPPDAAGLVAQFRSIPGERRIQRRNTIPKRYSTSRKAWC